MHKTLQCAANSAPIVEKSDKFAEKDYFQIKNV